jgi:hypothetical protein
MGAHEERVIQVKASLRQVRGLLALVHASAEFARRRDPKGARSDIDWAPSSGFIVLAAAGSGRDRTLVRHDFAPGELPGDLASLLARLGYEGIVKAAG